MSHTIVMLEHMREHKAENRLNELLRHCRIGKVMMKDDPADLTPQEP